MAYHSLKKKKLYQTLVSRLSRTSPNASSAEYSCMFVTLPKNARQNILKMWQRLSFSKRHHVIKTEFVKKLGAYEVWGILAPYRPEHFAFLSAI